MKHCDTACRSAAYRRRRRANANPAPATGPWPHDAVLPKVTGPPREQLPVIAEEFAYDVHLYLGVLEDADTGAVDRLLAGLEEETGPPTWNASWSRPASSAPRAGRRCGR